MIRTNEKLKFYSILKNETNYSEFVNHIRNAEHRRVGSNKFRIGNHNLKIETGRFTIPKTPEDLRICDHCNLNSVENELHILFHCDLYNDLRKTLFIKINDRNTLFTNYNIHDKVCFLFNNTDSHINRLTANFVFQAFERRKKHNKFYRSIISSHLYKMVILNKLVVVVISSRRLSPLERQGSWLYGSHTNTRPWMTWPKVLEILSLSFSLSLNSCLDITLRRVGGLWYNRLRPSLS